jgi:serine/threonine-protein kinase
MSRRGDFMDPQQGPPQPDLLIGQTIGNYLVTQKLGEGGMGAVYLAEHPAIGKKVALKVLHSEFSNNEEVTARFFHEAKAVNDIGHPNIVDIVDFGVIQGGGREQVVYFIMEYLAGVTLSQLIRAEAPMPPERALAIALQVADALSASHNCKIIHRDLKPDNIILVQRGRERDFVKLLDFGIAKLTGGNAMGSHRTRTGIVMGTPAYMSPEQCEGRDNLDLRTDVYALGIVLYEMLTGRVPFLGDGYGEILVQHLTQRPALPSQFRMLSAHVEAVVMKALEKRPDMRYPTMDEFMRAMADPVGYVEANGGVAGFLQRQLMPSSGPLTSSVRMSVPMTPPPGTLIAPVPMSTTPVPTTLNSASAQIQGQRNNRWVVMAGAAVVVGAIIAIVALAATGDKDRLANGSGAGAVVATGGAGGTATGAGAAGAGATTGSAGATTGSAGATTGSAGATTGTTGATGATTGSAGAATTVGSGDSTAASSVGAVGSGAVGSATEPTTGGTTGSAGQGSGSSAANPSDGRVDIAVDSDPAGARILVGGVDTQRTTPTTLSLPRGERVQIQLKLKGFDSYAFKPFEVETSMQLATALKAKSGGSAAPCRTPQRAGCAHDSKGCCIPDVIGPGGPGSGKGSGSATKPPVQRPADPDGLMHP